MANHRLNSNRQPDPLPVPPVALRISAEMLAALLRLDSRQHTIVGATMRRFGDYQLVELSVDAPNAPPGSVEMLPAYSHDGQPDPISLTHVAWLDVAGNKTVQPLAPTLPEPDGEPEAGLQILEQMGGIVDVADR
jgi:hypothetical protein